MKVRALYLFCFFVWSHLSAQCPIIPTPVEYARLDGRIDLSIGLKLDSTQFLNHNWDYLKTHFFEQTGISIQHSFDQSLIQFVLLDPSSTGRQYTIRLPMEEKFIGYLDEESQFHAINSLLQLLQKDQDGWFFQPCRVSDFAAFSWRGLHLDVSRHFYTVDEVKRFIDLMALYKFNTFHWHLTDDQGWRIEIKKHPKLTEIGAFRDSTMVGHYSDLPRIFDRTTYGGFYTQDQIREVVQYAGDRYVAVVPEIELPGHSRAALAAYPELSCTGEQNGVPGTWGIFDDIYCSKQETIDFMKDVLSEVVELFPSEYIHIGGDEAPKTRWNECPNCKTVMSENDLHDSHELQSYFIGQMDKFLTGKGKKLIGWDEILEGGLSPNAAVMSWRGTKGGIEAAKQQHEVVMTPTTYCYFDYYQSGHPSEPIAIGGFLPLEKVYQFNPIPDGLSESDKRYILGGQANLWTEYIASMNQLEYMTYPRALALAQAVWCKEKPSFDSFLIDFLTYQEEYLDRYNVNYARSIHQPQLEISRNRNGINIHFKGVEENYQFMVSTYDVGAVPKNNSRWMGVKDTLIFQHFLPGTNPKTVRTSVLDEGSTQTYDNDFILHSLLGAEIEMVTQPHPKYNNNGSLNLVDGIKGVLPWKGSQWLGFDTSNVEFIVDLGSEQTIKTINLGFLEQNGSWIYLPENVTIQVAKNPKWRSKKMYKKGVDSSDFNLGINRKCRYVRVMIHAMDIIPEGQEGGGNTPWTFIDEIQIKWN